MFLKSSVAYRQFWAVRYKLWLRFLFRCVFVVELYFSTALNDKPVFSSFWSFTDACGVVESRRDLTGKWSTDHCLEGHQAICEKKEGKTGKYGVLHNMCGLLVVYHMIKTHIFNPVNVYVSYEYLYSLLTSGMCYPGWKIHKGKCYQFVANQKETWFEAKHICEGQGGFMLVVET